MSDRNDKSMVEQKKHSTFTSEKKIDGTSSPLFQDLVYEIRSLIEETRSNMAVTVNSELTMLYWNIGKRINKEILKDERAQYGKRVITTLSKELTSDFGNGYSYSSLTRMVRFAEIFPDAQIIATLSQQLSWSHLKEILPIKDTLQREFYTEMCRIGKWSVRTLRERINSMLFERTSISKKSYKVIEKELFILKKEDMISPDLIFKDPYILDFLKLNEIYNEVDLESAIILELERFLLELGNGFTFIARQKRMVIDYEDHHLDLLFYHRKLKRMIAIELKIGKFKAGYKGQMELYLRWLEKYEMEEEENTPIGMILCAGGSKETIELLQLDRSGIRVAEYLTELPPKELLEKKLHHAINNARSMLEIKEGEKSNES